MQVGKGSIIRIISKFCQRVTHLVNMQHLPDTEMVAGHSMVCRWPQSQEGDWARPYLCKLARHGPWPVWKQFITDHVWRRWLSDSRVGNNSVVDHRSRRPVLSPPHNCVDRCHVWSIGHQHASRGGGCSKTLAYTANLNGLRWFESYCQLPLYNIEKEVQHCWALAAMRAAWVAGSLNSGTLNYRVWCWWDLCSWI